MNPVRYFFQAMIARAYVRVVGAQREMSWIVGDTLMPLLAVTAYIYIYRAMKAPEEYTGFVILGGVLMSFWVHTIWSMAMQLFWEKETGNLARYLMTPMARPALLMGMAFGGVFMTGTRAAVIFVSSYFIFDVKFNISDPWLAVAVFLVTLAALYGMGMTLSSVFFIAGRGVNHALQLMHEPIFFLGGFYFPVRQLGVLVASASAALIPITLGLDALRQIMFTAYETGLFKPVTELAILGIMAIVFTVLSVIAVRRLENLGRMHGKLTLQQQ